MIRMRWFLLPLLLAACVSASKTPDGDDDYVLGAWLVPTVQVAYDLMQGGEYEAAYVILDKLIEEKRDDLTPYEMATVLELRANAKFNLEDYDGAKLDYEAANSLDAFPPERQARLREYLEQFDKIKEEAEEPKLLQPAVTVIAPKECYGTGNEPDGDTGIVRDDIYVGFNVSIEGYVVGALVLDSTNECLNEPAITAVNQWRFIPRHDNGVPVRSEKESVRFGVTYSSDKELLALLTCYGVRSWESDVCSYRIRPPQ